MLKSFEDNIAFYVMSVDYRVHNALWGQRGVKKGFESYCLQGCNFPAEICVKGSPIVFKMDSAGKKSESEI